MVGGGGGVDKGGSWNLGTLLGLGNVVEGCCWIFLKLTIPCTDSLNSLVIV